MTMTIEEEHAFIKKELQWCEKRCEEKLGEFKIHERQLREAQFRMDITQKALDDFYEAHPEMKGDDNDK